MFTAIQENLFDAQVVERGAARYSDPQTSKDAAASVSVAELERDYLLALLRHPAGLTDSEIARESNHALNSISPRHAPLVRKGLIKDTDEKRQRSTVRVITEAGRRQVANQ